MDFYAAAHRLALEIDGDVHDAQQIEDDARTRILGAHGVRVLRLRNDVVLHDRDEAVRLIAGALGLQFHGAAAQGGSSESPSPDRCK